MNEQKDMSPFARAMRVKLGLVQPQSQPEGRDRMTLVDKLVKGDPVTYMRDGTPMPGHIAEIYEDEMHVKLFNGQVIPFVRCDYGDIGMRNAECGMRNGRMTQSGFLVSTFRLPHSPFHIRNPFLQQQMGVDAAETKGAYRRSPGDTILATTPGCRHGLHPKRTVRQGTVGRRRFIVQGRRQRFVLQGQKGFYQAGGTGGSQQMTDDGFDRTDRALTFYPSGWPPQVC